MLKMEFILVKYYIDSEYGLQFFIIGQLLGFTNAFIKIFHLVSRNDVWFPS